MKEFKLESQLIRAGAGTGKTTYLVTEVYNIFKHFRKKKNRDPKLIVCTFTRKATQELKERFFEKAINELSELNKKNYEQNRYLDKDLFLNYIQSSNLHISTIDGILNLFLKRYGHQIDLSPDFQITYGGSSKKLFESLADEFIFEKNFSLLQKFPFHYLQNLFLFYFNHRLKHGSISFYDENDFKKCSKDQNTYTKISILLKQKNTQELEQFIAASINKNNNQFKDFLLLDHLTDKEFEQFLEKDPIDKIKKIFRDNKTLFEEERFEMKEFVPVFQEFSQSAEAFFTSFLKKKKNQGSLDIEDLFLFSIHLLREKPRVASSFSKEWDYWLIDEYQDTNWAQEQIIHRITEFKNVFCVGDPAQSIYLFRGADPEVFKRREQALSSTIKKLDTNYRSDASLIYFYNDFFKDETKFIKFKPPNEKSIDLDKACVNFITYEDGKDKKETAKMEVFKALSYYIKKLRYEGANYGDIAILSSKKVHLLDIADYLRSNNFPLMLHSSKNFSEKRILLDALFLLKFLMNPYDNHNLKSLLRTAYFRFSDQELADSSYDYNQYLREHKENKNSFWSFIKNNFMDRVCIKNLNTYLEIQNERGLVKSFEMALMQSGVMDLSYFEDSTGSSEANLWKLLSLLNQGETSGLEFFYSLIKSEVDGEDKMKEAPSCEANESINLMTIHKSKGLEFKYVIIVDFSINQSPLKSENQKSEVIYDEEKQKMTFSVPLGGRDCKKIKCYPHVKYDKKRKQKKLLETERLFYVAMTRAEKSLAFFIPHCLPQKNSWLSCIKFFQDFQNHSDLSTPLLEIRKDKSSLWKLNDGNYKTNKYSFCVRSSESICNSPNDFIYSNKSSKTLKEYNKLSEQIKGHDIMYDFTKDTLPPALHKKSSKDFVNDTLTKNKIFTLQDIKKEDPIQMLKVNHSLFKRILGTYLHFFLQKFSNYSFSQVKVLVEHALLSTEDKGKILNALLYISELEEPKMNQFLKKGMSEWSFKLKKENILLQGQIDLWAWDNNEIFLFDYKSSQSQSKETKQQLIFYSWILEELYHPNKIWMYAVYPFQKRIDKDLYEEDHKNLVSKWLKNLVHK